LTISIAAAVAIGGAVVVFLLLTSLLNVPHHISNDNEDAVQDRRLLVEAFKAALALAAGLGAVVALALNYRRHRIEESQSHRDDQRLFTDRFQSAAEQLGHDQPAVRLAGVHAMTRLADDWDEQRQTCIDVLCAYLRLPPLAKAQLAAPIATVPGIADSPDEHQATTPREDREVRQTIVRLITEHLRVEPDDTTQVSWQGRNFDFTGVVFDSGVFDFEMAKFSAGVVSFRRATFSGGVVSFWRAMFSGGRVNFDGAEFSGSQVRFARAAFSGGRVSFDGSKFSDGQLVFHRAAFSGGQISFGKSVGQISFGSATFSGAQLSFDDATFSGSQMSFDGAEHTGGKIDFSKAATWEHPPTFESWEALPTGLLLPPR
jgi:uncharacterized protein YjbI with pentapeptide repeats